jgi:hypothetical protein
MGEYGRICLGGGGNHDGIRPRDGAYPPCILKTYAVAILDDRHIAPEALNEINDLLEAVDERTLTWTHVARAAVDCEAVDPCVDDTLYESQRVFLCRKQANLRGYGDMGRKFTAEGREYGA